MTHATQELSQLAVKLSPSERLQLVEEILASLDKPDAEIVAAWSKEADDRLAAYRRGEISAVEEDEVFGSPNNQ